MWASGEKGTIVEGGPFFCSSPSCRKNGGHSYLKAASAIMKSVFVLQHVHAFANDDEEVKFIGVYSSKEKAENAISRLIRKPGFKETKEGFCIDEYELNADHWAEGYVTEFPE